MTIGIEETWDLSADTRVLTINRMLKTPQGDFNTKITLNKK